MNEKLKELYFPLWKNYSITIRASENNDDYGFAYTTEYQEELFHSNMEKFAELIIRECLEACSRANDIRHLVPPTQQQVVLSCMDEIERTFRS
jgi:hypothetical protein